MVKYAPSLPDGRLLRSGLGFAREASADLPSGDTSLREDSSMSQTAALPVCLSVHRPSAAPAFSDLVS
ncbi:hypothetical protein GCWU000341_00822 [Oribacterium sp. oral taxon 078 str. F0262]|nr:hypothetical protein GCWU000341_00822 [Oribacterium sp. oral taxon 078 str. F0262]